MPIFQDDLGGSQIPAKLTQPLISSLPPEGRTMSRKVSEESIRTDLCEGPLERNPEAETASSNSGLESTFKFPILATSDRVELIERLKRGESPTWLPNRNLESLLQDHDHSSQNRSLDTKTSSPLLPAAEILESQKPYLADMERSQAGLQIERPRSALHTGDFTEGPQESAEIGSGLLQGNAAYGSRQSPWLSTSPPRHFTPFQLDPRFPSPDRLLSIDGPRSRAPSLSSSYSSSFILKPPTSPLVQSESNDDMDLSSQVNPIDISPAFQRNPIRRHTLQTSSSIHSTPSVIASTSFNRTREAIHPYQAHQPRRSLASHQMSQPSPSPQTPAFLRSRRPSYTSDNSPLHHASMVGSYEESILRGRMSTTPSKPLDFVAQIGVLGLGKCKSSLRCPAHVTIPFPAVFYSYETTTHGRTGKNEDGPSPYVGQIDLENRLPNTDEVRENRRKRTSAISANGRTRTDELDVLDGVIPPQPSDHDIRRAEKQKRRSTSPRAPPGGSYRIPEKGQLQIIIKNPNKTAVKLFLVPYDLAGMEPGTKTFIRQRSYSAGPIIDSALSSTPLVPPPNTLDRPTLRYLVHLHICSPSRGRYYLYKSIRVVFANRVPDGKEKLRNEISLPEPRFSVYKPGRESSLGLALSSGGAGATLAADKAFRRRSSGFPLGPSHRAFESMDGITRALENGFTGAPDFSRNSSTTPVQPIPFSLGHRSLRSEDYGRTVPENMQSPTSSKSSQPPTSRGSSSMMSWSSSNVGISGYDKLNKGDIGYGGNVFATSPDGKQVAEGLLAKKLRDLGVGAQNQQDHLNGI